MTLSNLMRQQKSITLPLCQVSRLSWLLISVIKKKMSPFASSLTRWHRVKLKCYARQQNIGSQRGKHLHARQICLPSEGLQRFCHTGRFIYYCISWSMDTHSFFLFIDHYHPSLAIELCPSRTDTWFSVCHLEVIVCIVEPCLGCCWQAGFCLAETKLLTQKA